jgi:hypothetical protein
MSAYHNSRAWTRVAITAARWTCAQLGLGTEGRVPFQFDVIGCDYQNPHEWKIRVAFEHEHKRADAPYELCKLAHIVADLKVLVAYMRHTTRSKSPEAVLSEWIAPVKAQIRFASSEWLLVMGPDTGSEDLPFMAFTLSTGLTPIRIHDERPLVPNEWMSL